MQKKSTSTYPLTISAILLGVGMGLPYLTGQLQAISKVISPLHIPVLLCGLCCGWQWGLGLGVLLPVLRGLTLGMPPFPAIALPMAFELGTYGLIAGLHYPFFVRLYKKKDHLPAMLTALITAMLLGRIVGGIAKAGLLALGIINSRSPFTFSAFIAGYFVATAPGALIQLCLLPPIALALERAGLSPLAKSMSGDPS